MLFISMLLSFIIEIPRARYSPNVEASQYHQTNTRLALVKYRNPRHLSSTHPYTQLYCKNNSGQCKIPFQEIYPV